MWEVEELGELQAVAAMVAGAMVVARATASMATTLMGGRRPITADAAADRAAYARESRAVRRARRRATDARSG